MNKFWRKLDNTAKIFSVEDNTNCNTYRLSIILKEKIKSNILKSAIKKTLEAYPVYKVKLKSGLFWNYLEYNSKDPIIEKENNIPCKKINFRKNNDYIFKVSYYKNKINLEIFHVLTDGVGATILLKELLYNYLNIKYNLKSNCIIPKTNIAQDQYLKNVDKKIKPTEIFRKAYLIKEKTKLFKNKTFHYIINLKKFKKICKEHKVSITEYLTALYIYALYGSVYDKKSKKDIKVTVPIDLRQHYKVNAFSNFFTFMDVEGKVNKIKNITFKNMLNQVKEEFKNKLTKDKIKRYLARDVKLGNNLGIRLVPLFIKKTFMKYFEKPFNQGATTTLSNIGQITIDNQYKKYIDNILVLVSVGKIQKIKCTICSYENNLTVTINSNLITNKFEKRFTHLLKQHIGDFKLESNV